MSFSTAVSSRRGPAYPDLVLTRRLLPLLVLLGFAACSRPEVPEPAATHSDDPPIAFASFDFDEALSRARAENKLVFVDVYADWCTWCHKLDHEVFTDERVKAALKDVLPIRVNAEKGSGRSVAARYRVRGLPTLLFVNADGNVVKRSEGYISADGFLKLLGQLPGSRI